MGHVARRQRLAVQTLLIPFLSAVEARRLRSPRLSRPARSQTQPRLWMLPGNTTVGAPSLSVPKTNRVPRHGSPQGGGKRLHVSRERYLKRLINMK